MLSHSYPTAIPQQFAKDGCPWASNETISQSSTAFLSILWAMVFWVCSITSALRQMAARACKPLSWWRVTDHRRWHSTTAVAFWSSDATDARSRRLRSRRPTTASLWRVGSDFLRELCSDLDSFLTGEWRGGEGGGLVYEEENKGSQPTF